MSDDGGVEKELLREATPGVDQGGTNAPGDERVVIALPPGALLTDRVLLAVRLERVAQDQRDGILRDYPDGAAPDPVVRALAFAIDEQRQRKTWMRQLMHAFFLVASAPTLNVLEQRLVELAAMSCAWAEGLHVRADDTRIATEQRALVMKNGKFVRLGDSWFKRLLAKLGLVK